uniref:Uncharacterized protein n=1 Tax=Globodera rostochiensis TaxID=31243 RepID=A0A914IFR0_GLORO
MASHSAGGRGPPAAPSPPAEWLAVLLGAGVHQPPPSLQRSGWPFCWGQGGVAGRSAGGRGPPAAPSPPVEWLTILLGAGVCQPRLNSVFRFLGCTLRLSSRTGFKFKTTHAHPHEAIQVSVRFAAIDQHTQEM